MRRILQSLPWPLVIMACVTLGLAPFRPMPHVWEKLRMLMGGSLSAPADIFDLLMHGLPWIILALKLALGRKSKPAA
jgi:hypothetical protein